MKVQVVILYVLVASAVTSSTIPNTEQQQLHEQLSTGPPPPSPIEVIVNSTSSNSSSSSTVVYTYHRRVLLRVKELEPGYYGRWKQASGIQEAAIWRPTDSTTTVELPQPGCYQLAWLPIPLQKVTHPAGIDTSPPHHRSSPWWQWWKVEKEERLEEVASPNKAATQLLPPPSPVPFSPLSFLAATVVMMEPAYAGPRQVVNTTSAVLHARPAPFCAVGVWSTSPFIEDSAAAATPGVVFHDKYSPTTAVSGLPAGVSRLRWSVCYHRSRWLTSEVEVEVRLLQPPPPLPKRCPAEAAAAVVTNVEDTPVATAATEDAPLPESSRSQIHSQGVDDSEQSVDTPASSIAPAVSVPHTPTYVGFVVVAVLWVLSQLLLTWLWQVVRQWLAPVTKTQASTTATTTTSSTTNTATTTTTSSSPQACSHTPQPRLVSLDGTTQTPLVNVEVPPTSAGSKETPASFISVPTSTDTAVTPQTDVVVRVLQTTLSFDDEVDVAAEQVSEIHPLEVPQAIASLSDGNQLENEDEQECGDKSDFFPESTFVHALTQAERTSALFLSIEPPGQLGQCEVIQELAAKDTLSTAGIIAAEEVPRAPNSDSDTRSYVFSGVLGPNDDESIAVEEFGCVGGATMNSSVNTSINPEQQQQHQQKGGQRLSRKREEFRAKFEQLKLGLLQDALEQREYINVQDELSRILSLDLKANPERFPHSAGTSNDSYFGSPGLLRSVADLSKASTPCYPQTPERKVLADTSTNVHPTFAVPQPRTLCPPPPPPPKLPIGDVWQDVRQLAHHSRSSSIPPSDIANCSSSSSSNCSCSFTTLSPIQKRPPPPPLSYPTATQSRNLSFTD